MVLCSVNSSYAMQNHIFCASFLGTNFEHLQRCRGVEPVKALLKKKKIDHYNSLKSGNAPEGERCTVAMYFIKIVVPDAI